MPIRRIIELYIHEYVRLQKGLLRELENAHPHLNIEKELHNLPKKGTLSLDGVSWLYKKHGIGIMFCNSYCIVVDVNNKIGEPDAFDSWRLMQYIESVDKTSGDLSIEVTEGEIDVELSKLCRSGFVIRVDSTHYALSERA